MLGCCSTQHWGNPDFHAKEFKAYLKRGVQIKRLDKKLLKLDVDKLCQAIDPSADLDFGYLGIQTLYDRYLVVDKTGEIPRRLETPIFLVRVAMGVYEENLKSRL